jgi:opacity protein-like surface antigen
MMMQGRALIIGTFAALVSCAAAQAADMPGSWPPPYEHVPPRFTEMVSGWYIRGDVGYRFNHLETLQAPQAITSAKYSDSVGFTGGAGYKYDWFRADVTVDYGARVTARAASASSFAQPQYTTKIDPLSILGNVYLDLGTWWGFTPYVGAGAGGTGVRRHEYTDTAFLPADYSVSNGRTNFSWAAMVGVSYRIDARWVVDVGYRHLDMGDLQTTAATTTGLLGDTTVWKRLTTDEVRIGLRFILD